ncbi:phage holin family protein [Bacillus sp. es.036]|uniref:phage holin family protein n=1 Tax=Bacillus sp. es.036 TaxID=1761764 RepID=UPI000BF30748|nr:phage holin family protein [Bacillus sp. es.036]PFG13079.1 holin family Hol44 protein (superfamily V) [Bacillus sp. es.036]
MDLQQFIQENYLFLVPALWVIGTALKKTPKVPDWSIIWVLIFISIFIATLSFGFNTEALVNAIVASGISVMGHQLYKQTKNI